MNRAGGALLQRLSSRPVLGVPLANVSLLRLDRCAGPAPGNKSFKLRINLQQARQLGYRRVLSFGGAWSNHLHALAACGREMGLETIGVVRGDEQKLDTAMLADVRDWGMRLLPVSRAEYRRRHDRAYREALRARFAPCLVVPEGGANGAGVRGCLRIADCLRSVNGTKVVVPVGTGGTLAGLAAGLAPAHSVTGIAALKGASDLEQRVEGLLSEAGLRAQVNWHILHSYHCGGFARVSDALRKFILAFERVQGIPLEPVYTGKMMFAVHSLLALGEWPANEPLVAVHTGGLQGRRGYSWLDG